MQHGPIRLVAYGFEHAAFVVTDIAQQGQRLVAVASEYDVIDMLDAGGRVQLDHARATMSLATHGQHGARQALLRNARQQFFHIHARSAPYRTPLRPVAHLQQAMVVAETDKRGQGKGQHLARRARPDTGGHRQQIPVAKFIAIAVQLEKLAQRQGRRRHAGRGQGAGLTVEAHDIAQHAQEGGAQQVAALGKHGIEIGARPFQYARIGRRAERHFHGKRHVAVGRLDTEFSKQLHQVRVGGVVEHEKTRVDAMRDAIERDIHRMAVAAKIVTRLVQGDVLACLRQAIGTRQTCNSCSDDGNFHEYTCIKFVLDKMSLMDNR